MTTSDFDESDHEQIHAEIERARQFIWDHRDDFEHDVGAFMHLAIDYIDDAHDFGHVCIAVLSISDSIFEGKFKERGIDAQLATFKALKVSESGVGDLEEGPLLLAMQCFTAFNQTDGEMVGTFLATAIGNGPEYGLDFLAGLVMLAQALMRDEAWKQA